MSGSLNPVPGPGRSGRAHGALTLVVVFLLTAGVIGALLVEPPASASRAVSLPPTTTTTTIPPPTFVPEPEPTPPPKRPSKPVSTNTAEGSEPIVKIGTIEIPKIGLVHDLYHGITMRNINLGPSHWPGTAMPGEVGNTVIAGHRVTKTHPFRNIHLLQNGDEIIFTVQGQRSVYRVNGNRIVTPKQIEIVNPTPTATATLFACHPPGSARFRYVVTADLAAA
jgi:sortase A